MIRNIPLFLVFISTIFPIKGQIDTSLTLEKKKLVILPSQNKKTDDIADKLFRYVKTLPLGDPEIDKIYELL